MPFGTISSNSAAKLRMAFANIVCCLTSRDRTGMQRQHALLL